MNFLASICFVGCIGAVSLVAQENLDDTLLQAVRDENVESVKSLIAKGANVNAKSSGGNTPLHCAAEYMAIECLGALLSNGADVNARNDKGKTPFMGASNTPKTIGILLDAGADLNVRDNDGRTALMNAAAGGEVTKIKMLLQRNADVSLRSPAGKTALDIAIQTKHETIAALLRGEIQPEIKCSKLETEWKLLGAKLIDGKKRELTINVEAVFVVTRGNSDDTFTGNLTLSLSDEERDRIARWAEKDLSDAGASVELNEVIAGFTRNAKCPEIELEFSPRSIAEKGFLLGVKLNIDRFRLGIKLDEGEPSKMICIWARNISSGRGRRNNVRPFNDALNCAEFDRGN